jgi:hypothetical protein
VLLTLAASVMSKTVDKAFGQSKCKPNAQELALLFIEAEAGEHVTDELIKGCGSKQPKIAGASAECLRMAVQSFGLRALGPQSKAIVKLSVTLFDRFPFPHSRLDALPSLANWLGPDSVTLSALCSLCVRRRCRWRLSSTNTWAQRCARAMMDSVRRSRRKSMMHLPQQRSLRRHA